MSELVEEVPEDEDDSWDDELDSAKEQAEPLDLSAGDRKLVTQPYDLGVKGINEDIRRGRLKLVIEYQRKYVWDQSKASRLIESLLLNVPIPVCYFAEDEDGNYEVIDGLQRLTTIRRFIEDDFPLSGISVLKELEGKVFSELAPRDQRRLENRTIRCIVITEESHPDIKFDVFERLNTGAASLTAQELRNCIYRGDLNDALKEMAQKSYFLQLMGNSTNRRMEHEELALRFLALVEGVVTYRPPLRQFLNSYMRKNRNSTPSDDVMGKFQWACESVYAVLGDSAFKVVGKDGRYHRIVNKALFDSVMIPFAYAANSPSAGAIAKIKSGRDKLLQDEEFLASIGRATADRTRMILRINKFRKVLEKAGIVVDLPTLDG
jgi:hypothetical protein